MTTLRPTIAAHDVASFRALDWLLLAATAGIWGASFLFIEIGLDAFEPGLVTWLRVAFGCATLWAIPLQRRRVERADWPRVAALGVTWMAFPLTMFPVAQQWINSSLTGMLNGATPVFATLLGILVFGVPAVRTQIVGVAVGLVGLFLIGIPEASAAGTTALGVLAVVAAVASYGIALNLAGPLQRTYGALPVLRRALVVATVLTVPYGAIDAGRSGFAWGPLAACIALGVGGTAIAFVTMTTLTGRVGSVRASITTYLIPIVSIVLGVVFRDESLSAWAIVGTGVVLTGAFVAANARRS